MIAAMNHRLHHHRARPRTATENMVEFLTNATIVLMGLVVIAAGVIVAFYG